MQLKWSFDIKKKINETELAKIRKRNIYYLSQNNEKN